MTHQFEALFGLHLLDPAPHWKFCLETDDETVFHIDKQHILEDSESLMLQYANCKLLESGSTHLISSIVESSGTQSVPNGSAIKVILSQVQ
jgi:hypothetical protein